MRKLIVLSGAAILTAMCILFSLWLVNVASGATSTVQAKHQSYVDNGLLCIHRYEGSWTDPNAPYWGGLQMDMNFQNAYGYRWIGKHKRWGHKISFVKTWGTADHWPIWAQMAAGRHGYYARGWSPWYKTAHLCGLI